MSKKCSHEDSRLTCSQCDEIICSNCLIQCPVGFRCSACVNSGSKAKPTQSPKFAFAKAFGASFFVGLVAGWLIPFMAIPWISCFICFFMGIYSGRWLAQHLNHSALGPKIAPTVVFGLLIGMSLGPLSVIPLSIASVLTGSVSSGNSSIFHGLNDVVSLVFDPVCFFAGILRPTLWGDY